MGGGLSRDHPAGGDGISETYAWPTNELGRLSWFLSTSEPSVSWAVIAAPGVWMMCRSRPSRPHTTSAALTVKGCNPIYVRCRRQSRMAERSRSAPELGDWILRFLQIRSRPDRRVSREELKFACRMAGWNDADDRAVRKAIEDLRREHPDGPCILSSSDRPGYFWSQDPELLEATNAEELSRIDSARAKVENRRRAIQRLRALPLEQERMTL